MKLLVWGLIYCTLCLPFAQANELCERAGIVSLKLGKSEEVCSKSVLDPQEIKALEHIAQIHTEVAELFHVEVHELFSLPFSVQLSEYAFGALISSANASFMHLGVYPGSQYKINTGVYLHELGHTLAGNRNPKLPLILEDLDHSVLFSETFADLLALTVHGHIITPSENPTCLDRVRFITDFQSYNYPQEYFENLSEARLMKCCESLKKTSTDETLLNVCKAADGFFTAGIHFTQSFNPLKESKSLDDHQIGIPLLSFLQNFSKRSSSNLKELFEKILFPSGKPSVVTYVCELKRGTQVIRTEEVTAHTATQMIEDLKHTLNAVDLELFEELLQKHAIHKGLTFSELQTPKHILEKFQERVAPERGNVINCRKSP